MKTKAVAYAYPTSPAADHHGFKKGCHIVEVWEGVNTPPKDISAHEKREDAIAAARKLDLPWQPLYLHCHPTDI